jgi:hypothetical protein
LFNFGYDTNLILTKEFIKSKLNDLPKDGVFELSKDSIQFLVMLWDQYESTDVADIYILERIFSTMEGGCPFLATEIAVIENGKITLSTWIDIWQMLVHKDPQQAFKYALYLGYNSSLKSFIEVIRKNRWSIFGLQQKSVFECGVIQIAPMFFDKFIGPSLETARSAVISLEDHKTLIMRELSEDNVKGCDICLFVHDGSVESANFIKVHCKHITLPKAIIDISEGMNVAVPVEKVIQPIKGTIIPRAKVSLDSKTQVVQSINRLLKILYILSIILVLERK